MTDVQDRTESAREQIYEALQRLADGFSYPRRSPVLHSPAQHGLDYEDITFPARDGVPLEGWFIPAPGSGKLITGVGLDERIPQEWAKNVRVPTFLYQVRGDILTDPSDVQTMFDNIPVAEKKLHWIEGTTARFDGYLEFQRRPQPMLDWFAQYMSSSSAQRSVRS